MGAENTTTFDGLKRRYVGTTEDLIPSYAICQQIMPFDSKNRVGDRYEIHVRTKRPHGMTANGGATFGDMVALNAARAGQTRKAFVTPFSYVLRDQVSYDLLALAGDNQQAFEAAFDGIVHSCVESARAYQEGQILYGAQSYGRIESNTVNSATNHTYTLTKASWAVGLMTQFDGAAIDVYTTDNDGGVKLNTNGLMTIDSVNADTRQITVTGIAADITAVAAAIATGAYIKPLGVEGKWGLGISRVLQHTSGTLFGLDSTANGLWKANRFDCGGTELTLAKILNGAARIVGKGGLADLDVLVSHWTFTDLNIDTIQFKRTADDSKTDFKAGVDSIELMGPQGRIRIVQHPMVKAGHALAIARKTWKRVGAYDVSWSLPGNPDDKFLHQVPDQTGMELRNYQCVTPFCNEPAKNLEFYNIVNRSL